MNVWRPVHYIFRSKRKAFDFLACLKRSMNLVSEIARTLAAKIRYLD